MAIPIPIPITIITGFLGAGKTTLLNHVLHGDHGLRVAVLVNDFGAVNIDAALIVGVDGETVSLSNGCICCTIRDDLLSAVWNLVRRESPPEYIIVEASGVSDPLQVAETFLLPALRPFVAIDAIVTVVDAEQIADLPSEFQMLAMDQISTCDIVVLNKVDLVDQAGLRNARGFIREIAPDARVIEVNRGRAPLELLLSVGMYAPERLRGRTQHDVHVHEAGTDSHEHDHAHTHADHTLVFNTWTYETDAPLVYEKLRQALDNLPVSIFRAKGFLNIRETPDRKCVLHLVGRRIMLNQAEPWGGSPRRTQIVVIGTVGGVQADKLQVLFDRCRADADAAKGTPVNEAASWVRKLWPGKSTPA